MAVTGKGATYSIKLQGSAGGKSFTKSITPYDDDFVKNPDAESLGKIEAAEIAVAKTLDSGTFKGFALVTTDSYEI